jgi:hypothetical protein
VVSKRADLESYLYEIHRINPEVDAYFDAPSWADNLLELLGLEIQTTEKVVVK